MKVNDHTGFVWLTAFHDVGVKIVGSTADDMKILSDTVRTFSPSTTASFLTSLYFFPFFFFLQNPDGFKSQFDERTFRSYVFRVRSKMETYQEESRTKYTIMGLDPVDYVGESRKLIDEIKQYSYI